MTMYASGWKLPNHCELNWGKQFINIKILMIANLKDHSAGISAI